MYCIVFVLFVSQFVLSSVLFFAFTRREDPVVMFAIFAALYVVPMQLLSLVITALIVKFIQTETNQHLQTPLLRRLDNASEESEERRVPRQYEI